MHCNSLSVWPDVVCLCSAFVCKLKNSRQKFLETSQHFYSQVLLYHRPDL